MMHAGAPMTFPHFSLPGSTSFPQLPRFVSSTASKTMGSQMPSSFKSPSTILDYLWALQIPPKIKAFLGKSASSIIPIGVNLRKRRLSYGICSICHKDVENWSHCLFYCDRVNNFWITLTDFSQLAFLRHGSFLDLCLFLMNDPLLDVELLYTLLWFIWREKCSAIFNSSQPQPTRIWISASTLLAEFSKASIVDQNWNDLCPFPTHWTLPPLGWMKLNVDASVINELGSVGFVLRNCESNIVLSQSLFVGLVASDHAECLAIHYVILETARLWSRNLLIESDCSPIIARILSDDIDITPLGSLANCNKKTSKMFNMCNFNFISRSCNSVAYLLAKLDFSIPISLSDNCNWGTSSPQYLVLPLWLM